MNYRRSLALLAASVVSFNTTASLVGCASAEPTNEPGGGLDPIGGDPNGSPAASANALFAERLCNTDFCWQVPTLQGNDVNALSFVADDRGWAVGEGGAFLRFGEGAWRAASAPTWKTLNGVWAAADNDVWAVGDGGVIVHFDGKKLDVVPSGTNESLAAVWGTSANRIWAAGAKGSILAWNGSAWSVAANTGDEMHAIWGSGPSDVFVVGGTLNVSAIAHWDGATWTTIDSNFIENGLYAIGGTSKDDVWAIGNYGKVWHKDAADWTLQDTIEAGREPPLRTLTVLDPSDVWATSPDTTYHFDGHAWTTSDATRGALALATAPGSKSIWASSRAGSVRRIAPMAKAELAAADLTGAWVHDDRDVYFRTRAGDVLHFDGTAWSSIGRADGEASDVALAGTADGVLLVAAKEGGIARVKAYDGAWHSLPALPAGSEPYAPIVGAGSLTDVWIGWGSDGFASLLHFDGAWKSVSVPTPAGATSARPRLLQTVGVNDTWVMGQAEASGAGSGASASTPYWAHYDGTSWTSGLVPHAASVVIDAFWVAGKNDLWMSGVSTDWTKGVEGAETSYPTQPFVSHYDGSQWTRQTLPGGGASYAGATHAFVAAQGASAWVVLQGGPALADNALAFDGTGWRSRPLPAVPGAVWVTPTSAWALSTSGDSGGLLRTR